MNAERSALNVQFLSRQGGFHLADRFSPNAWRNIFVMKDATCLESKAANQGGTKLER